MKPDPRKRMAEIRTYVKRYMKGKNPDNLNHLGEYPKGMNDARRVIVALQDELDKSHKRHRKASDRIVNLLKELKDNRELTDLIRKDSYQKEARYHSSLKANRANNSLLIQSNNTKLSEIVELKRLLKANDQLFKEQNLKIGKHFNTIEELRAERDAMITTYRLLKDT